MPYYSVHYNGCILLLRQLLKVVRCLLFYTDQAVGYYQKNLHIHETEAVTSGNLYH
jgi:hypothetical protein